MKSLLICTVAAITLIFSVAVAAGGYKSYGHGYGYNHSGYKHHGYKSHGYKHRKRRSHRSGYLLGGLVLGSALTYAFTRPHYYSQPDYYPHQTHYGRYRSYPTRERVVYKTRVIEQPIEVVASRYLHRDLQGNCFEIKRNEHGDELRVELPASVCDW